ncbi:uncharacterized protein LOC101761498 isoform X2 [Setaria italica]|uniref:uncharacterized protein LOC101761498 isoform X2 n=1 Tax=Setaria italica TaxID=4555 RepID=UPI000646F7D9|nr:uncharacterized protein LOC101761498 isoform X2 [Setaria italica]
MSGHRIPAAARLGGITSRRHAELLLHSGVGDVSVKDLRLRRVVPPASGSLDSSPVCAAPVKPGSVESTPPEAASAVAVAEDLDRKPVLPRSKLVRDPGSFGYRRLLPFLNEMAKNDSSIGRSDSPLVDAPLGEIRCESDAMDSVEPVVAKTGGDPEVKDGCNNVTEEANTVPHDLASSKPWLARCTRSRFVRHPSSFSYKRMLPFLMENEISSQEGERVKIRRVADERILASDENGVSASGQQHLAVSDDSSQECNRAQVDRMEEEETPKADENHVLDDRQPQPAVTKASPPECNAAEGQNVMQQEALTTSQDPLTSSEGDLTSDGDVVQASGHHHIVVSEDSPEECQRDEVKRSVQDEAVKSDWSHVLDSREFQPAVSEVFPSKNSVAEVQKATQEESLPSDGDEENSNKGDHLAKEQPQPCVTKESLTAQPHDSAEITEVPQCQNKDAGSHDAGFVSPTKTVIPLLHRHCAQPEDSVTSVDDQLCDSDVQMICRPSDPCAVDRSLSVEEMSGCIPLTESGCKAGISRPRGLHSTEKRGFSPKKLSPKKGILKKHTRGCKGICMCLDCCTFRLRADRAFEFSRKQMQEADDIICNLLKEVASLRSLVEKPAGQESTQAACKRASQVEEVARERCRQMFVDLNSHCRIPGPRVRFAQYVEEKKASPSPREKKASPSPRSSSSSSWR